MKCVDCLHYDMCPDKDIKNPAYPTETFADLNNIEKTCVHFKDADRYMELACKVGEYAYRVVSSDYESMRVGKYKIVPILMHDQYEIVKMMKEAEDWRKFISMLLRKILKCWKTRKKISTLKFLKEKLLFASQPLAYGTVRPKG